VNGDCVNGYGLGIRLSSGLAVEKATIESIGL
jgi:hypothetical protein